MGLFSKNKDKKEISSGLLIFKDGINIISKESLTEITFYKDTRYLSIDNKFSKNKDIKLSLDKIIDLNFYTENEKIEKDKSSLGRAVVGGALLGPVGAVIGGVSGVGTKTKSKINNFTDITYKTDSNEINILKFQVGDGNFKIFKFIESLKKEINTKVNINEEIYL